MNPLMETEQTSAVLSVTEVQSGKLFSDTIAASFAS